MPSTIETFRPTIQKLEFSSTPFTPAVTIIPKKEDSQAKASLNRPDYYLLACKAVMTLSACMAYWQSPPAAVAGTILGFTVSYAKELAGVSEPEDKQSTNYRIRMGYSSVMSAVIASGLAILQNENFTIGGSAGLAYVTTKKVFYPYVREQLQ